VHLAAIVTATKKSKNKMKRKHNQEKRQNVKGYTRSAERSIELQAACFKGS
jgi:hypothetical protein